MDTTSPTNALRKRLVEDMNNNIDLGTHWLMGGAAAFLVVEKDNLAKADVIASMHVNSWLEELDAADRKKVAACMACQLRIEIYLQLRLEAPACDCPLQRQHRVAAEVL